VKLPLHSHRSRHSRGQALVEFAVILPILLLVVLLALDFGRVFFGWVGLQNAARQGANHAALNPTAWGTPGDPEAQALYLARIENDANGLNCTLETPVPTPAFPDGNVVGGRSEVQLSCAFLPITPLVSALFPGGVVTIGANAVFPIRKGVIGGIPVDPGLPSPTPTPTPTPTPEAGEPTPTPTPMQCQVPNFSGFKKNQAQGIWTGSLFTSTVVIDNKGVNGNWQIQYQDILSGQWINCSSIITVAPF
jgi:hypothetical protein